MLLYIAVYLQCNRQGFNALLEWLAALDIAEGMNEWIAESEAARFLAGRLRNDHA